MEKKILITGGTGFLGAYIIQELVETGHSVRAIRRSNKLPFFISPSLTGQVEWVEGDILDLPSLQDAMDGVYAVVHAAAKVSFTGKERKALFDINIEGTANVVNMAIEQDIQRFIHVSSVAALGRTARGEQVTEDKKWEGNKLNTNYAISKYHGEVEVWRGVGEGLPAVIVNPSTILGYGDWNTSSCAIFRSVFREFPWYTNGVNGFVDVKDVARAVSTLLDSDIIGERFILNGENWSFRQLFNCIAAGFGKKPPSREATPFLGAVAWRLEKLKTFFSGNPSLLTRESAQIAQSSTYFDNQKILQCLPGFKFTPLQDSINDACNAYLANI
jgi:nucleoside-diphosphate-sugar epimerase